MHGQELRDEQDRREQQRAKRLAKRIRENTRHAEEVNAQIPPGVVAGTRSGYSYVTVDPRDGRLTYTEI
jgi:hypothetical protein